MTIDEEYNGCRNCKYQPGPLQTCDWLKHQKIFYKLCPMWELKEYKSDEFINGLQKLAYHQGYSKAESDYFENSQIDRESIYKIGHEIGYNKAITDFVNACKENVIYKTFGLRECDIEQIAKQLKEGRENE